MEKEIEINYDEFHNLYEKAKKEKKDYFTDDGKVILTSYAKYLLEYLKKRIKW